MLDTNAAVQVAWALTFLLLAIAILIKPKPSDDHRDESADFDKGAPKATASTSSPFPPPVDVPAAAPDPLLAAQFSSCLQMLGETIKEIRRSNNGVHEAVSRIDVLAGLPQQMQAVESSAREMGEARKGEAEAKKLVRQLEARASVDRHAEKRLTRIEAQLRAQEAEDGDIHGRLSRVEAQLESGLDQSARARTEAADKRRAERKKQTSKLLARARRDLAAARDGREKTARELGRTRRDLTAARAKLGELEAWKMDATDEYRRMAEKYAEESRLARELFEDHREVYIKFEAGRDEARALQQQLDALQKKHDSLLMATRLPSSTNPSPSDELAETTAAPQKIPETHEPIDPSPRDHPTQHAIDTTSSIESLEGNGDNVSMTEPSNPREQIDQPFRGKVGTGLKPMADVYDEGEFYGTFTSATFAPPPHESQDGTQAATIVSGPVPSASEKDDASTGDAKPAAEASGPPQAIEGQVINAVGTATAPMATPRTIGACSRYVPGAPPPRGGGGGPAPAGPTTIFTNVPPVLAATAPFEMRFDFASSGESPYTTELGLFAPSAWTDAGKASSRPSATSPIAGPANASTPPAVTRSGLESDPGRRGTRDARAVQDHGPPAAGSPPLARPPPGSQPAAPHHEEEDDDDDDDNGRPIRTPDPIPKARYSAAYFEAWRGHITTGFNAGHFAREILELDDADEAHDSLHGWVARVRERELDMETADFRPRDAGGGGGCEREEEEEEKESYSGREVLAMALWFFRDVVWEEFRRAHEGVVEDYDLDECRGAFERGVEAYMAEHPADA